MDTKKPKPEAEVHDLSKRRGELKRIGGSMSDDWNLIVANQAAAAVWPSKDVEQAKKQRHAAVNALIGIAPGDEFEGMLAAQIIACHNASMECYRRAMLREQTFEGRQEALNQANKLSRTYAMLLEALNRHRGKAQQKVTVEHVHVHSGGQAVVGVVQGGGDRPKSEDQAHAKQVTHAPQPTVWSRDQEREPVPVSGDAERPLPHARRTVAGGPEGE